MARRARSTARRASPRRSSRRTFSAPARRRSSARVSRRSAPRASAGRLHITFEQTAPSIARQAIGMMPAGEPRKAHL